MFKRTIDNTSIATFDKVSRTGNLRLLSSWPLPKWWLARLWDGLMRQFVDEIGLSATRMRYYREMRAYCKFMIKVFEGQNHFSINAEYRLGRAADAIESTQGGVSLSQSVIGMGRFQGYHLKPEELSIREYFELTKSIKAHG